MQLKIAVGIPTVGRSTVLSDTLRELAQQSRQPDRVVVCGTSPTDMTGAVDARPGVTLLQVPAGLPRQRNAILNEMHDVDVVVFFDDDFIPHPAYLQMIERHMAQDQRIVVATGRVLADGIGGPGLTFAQGRAIIDSTAYGSSRREGRARIRCAARLLTGCESALPGQQARWLPAWPGDLPPGV
jgi:glycosyltransferase involved in cell wall biosynthesis